MDTVLGLRCVRCEKEWSVEQIQYTCPSCQNNLDVVYDYAKIAQRISKKSLQENRDYSIWRYRSFYPVDNFENIPSLQIGWTPLYKSKKQNLYIKDDGRNPSASFKDRASAIALLDAISKKSPRIMGASTGNAGSSIACLGASADVPITILVPNSAPQAKLAQLLIFGATVVPIDGNYDQAFDLCQEIALHNNWYNRNTGYNPYTREGKKSCAFEICEQLNWQAPDWVFVSVGDGNIISGIWKGFYDLYHCKFIDKLPRLVAVQSSKSNAIHQAFVHFNNTGEKTIKQTAATTIADSISVDIPRDGLAALNSIIASKGLSVEVDDSEILCEIRNIARDFAVFAEPAGATSVAGFNKLVAQNVVKEEEVSVCIITGNGLKDISSALSIVKRPQPIAPCRSKVEEYLQRRN
ncbi:threonine synthase [Candidatus Uabimicrobium amorphum]|uniref:Threonine synthase n=1 Tax=Uabimicrobium amorphum TaxID=2596890 RepID=A0A5S9IKA9_UABAM|nr:threonine synthase [Candidatus Uabimicrobium amorphum]BBM83110.1 threonine synthase [Candidatus Uabimicrobium amorphum]